MEWEKIFANEMNDKWLISKVYKQPSSNSISLKKKRKKNDPGQKWANNLNRHFCKEEIQMASRHMKKMLNITNYYKNANQNNEISPYTCQNEYHQKS